MRVRKVWVVEISGEVEVHAATEQDAIAIAMGELHDVGNFHFEAIDTGLAVDDEDEG